MIRRAALPAAVLCLSPSSGAAHAFGARYDLPLPLAYYLGAAALAVAVSFLAAWAFLGKGSAKAFEVRIDVHISVARFVRLCGRAIGLLTLFLLIAASFVGPPEVTRNLATVFVWVIWWVGFLLTAALIVAIWPALDPFRAMGSAACRVFHRADFAALPRFAVYLAPFGILFLVWIELVSDLSEDPRALGILIVTYAASAIIGSLVFGPVWFERADPMARLFELLGRMAIVRAQPNGITIGPPGEGLLHRRPAKTGESALVCVLLGAVLFDGLSEVPAWAAVLDFISGSQTLRSPLLYLRGHGVDLLKLIQTLGLLSTILATGIVYLVLSWAISLAAGRTQSTASIAAAFAQTLLPIAAAYHLSHYLSYLLIAGQLALPAASDPLGLGWDLFGWSGWALDITIIGTRQIWWIAFGSLVAGHALAVLAAHRQALIVFGDPGIASRSQIPMTIAMIGLTTLSLWILSQPITE